jgi:hypothetical protein
MGVAENHIDFECPSIAASVTRSMPDSARQPRNRPVIRVRGPVFGLTFSTFQLLGVAGSWLKFITEVPFH